MMIEDTKLWLLNLQETFDVLSDIEWQKKYWLGNHDYNDDVISSFDEEYHSFMDIFDEERMLKKSYFSDFGYMASEKLQDLLTKFFYLYKGYHEKNRSNYISDLTYHRRILSDAEWLSIVYKAKEISAELITEYDNLLNHA